MLNSIYPKYQCILDQEPGYLLPEHFINSMPKVHDYSDLVLSDSLLNEEQFVASNIVPADVISMVMVDNNMFVLWVKDPHLDIYFPFWLGREYINILKYIEQTGEVPLSAPVNAVRQLYVAGILLSKEEINNKEIHRQKKISKSIDSMIPGYLKLNFLIHPFHFSALRIYYRKLTRLGLLKLGDSQSPLRYVAHNEPVASLLHYLISPMIGNILQKKVKPSYCYSSVYTQGSELPPHIDRPQCEYSVTMCIDHTPEMPLNTNWPLYLNVNGKTIAVEFGIGQCLLYKGREIQHYRKKLNNAQTSTYIFFHYVDQEFNQVLQ